MSDTLHDPAGAPGGAHTDFAGNMSYGDYLQLETLLSAQTPRSANHNEMLFIIQHQTTELWLKLVLHELREARERIRQDDLQPAFKMLARVSRIMAQLIQAWDVLSTLTPSEYLSFRGVLGKASGFQSHQYRLIEFLLGNRNPALTAPHRHRPAIHDALEAELARPSLYEEAIQLLERRGVLGAGQAGPAVRSARQANPAVEMAWAEVYRAPDRHWDLYELAEELVDLEDYFRQWRFRHVTTVERVIGLRRGTGGTAGVPYLRSLLEVRLFPELWDLRTRL